MIMIIGPFKQLLTMANMPLKGPLVDDQLEIIADAGLVIYDNIIVETGNYIELRKKYTPLAHHILEGDFVCLPAMIDAHTHCCWAGSRAADFAARMAGKSYLDIAAAGGGIMDTVRKTRNAGLQELADLTTSRANSLFSKGTTTIEIKSGYGLTVAAELKMLEAIKISNYYARARLIPTCLAAHTLPSGFIGNEHDYLKMITEELLPEVKKSNLSRRVDVFIEKGAFSEKAARKYLTDARSMGFDVVIHGDQFSRGAASLAIELGALSIDHLEAADDYEIEVLARGNTIPVALPGASLGLGEPFAPARQLLDAGTSLAIASDWNPGSAPMGNLLAQAAILGVAERLSMAEVWAALTYRAAAALGINNQGVLKKDMQADFIAYKTNDYREILYRQGAMRPHYVFTANQLHPCDLLQGLFEYNNI